MRGHWDVNTVKAYRTTVLGAAQQLLSSGCASGSVLAFVDARELGAQSQQVIASYREHLGSSSLLPRRLATVVSSALFKRQVERIAIPNQQLFADEIEAMNWLLGADDRV